MKEHNETSWRKKGWLRSVTIILALGTMAAMWETFSFLAQKNNAAGLMSLVATLMLAHTTGGLTRLVLERRQ
ncbi:MAG: hypothetical protein J7M25_01160 [Deltaproteobacteria bacterium]|nr:hypothetical protein [Deltaproteobacteria bacterium]